MTGNAPFTKQLGSTLVRTDTTAVPIIVKTKPPGPPGYNVPKNESPDFRNLFSQEFLNFGEESGLKKGFFLLFNIVFGGSGGFRFDEKKNF